MKETRALEQRRVQQRMKYMEKEIAELNKQLATAQTNIQKLNEEKTVLMKRGEIIREVKAITLASVARENHENGRSSFSDDSDEIPTFYKKDLMMILKERNELKLTISSLQEELYTIKLRLKDYEAELKPQRKSMTFVPRRKKPSSLASPVFNDDVKDYTERVEESMVIVEKTDTLSIPTKHKRPTSYSSPVFHSSSESLSQCSTVIEVPPPNKLKERHLSISTSL
jgi:chromosome segregation ATPase